jgi:hypothetical protein
LSARFATAATGALDTVLLQLELVALLLVLLRPAVLPVVVPVVLPVALLRPAALDGVGLTALVLQALVPVVTVATVVVLLVLLVAAPAPAVAAKSDTAPAEDCVPLSAPPEVLTQTSLSVSGLCQKLGATSITT